MRGLGKLVSRMNRMRDSLAAANANDPGRLQELTNFGSNPGALDCRVYVPSGTPTGLVVVLHGCTQNASVYDHGSGWSQLAERHGFAVLFPQQRSANNSNLCFNWYSPRDARRGRGEAKSISQMVEHVAAWHGLDRSQTFVTGLSAGGAMTAVMLACYPELFAGGAIIAGLPFATANTLPEALERMRGQGTPRGRDLAARAAEAAPPQASPPILSVWHGTSDTIVDPANAAAIARQWLDLHGIGAEAGRVETIRGHRREVWLDSEGRAVVEKFDIRGMGHGTPLDTRGSEACGTAGPHMLDANICSTRWIANSWGLIGQGSQVWQATTESAEASSERRHAPQAGRGDVGAVIEDALRAAGLMR